jgi:nitroreductase
MKVIEGRRSVRQFQREAPVSDEVVRQLLRAGIMAPSSGNSQVCRFVVVRDETLKQRLALEAGHQSFIEQAPVVIVVCADLEAAEKKYGERGRGTYALQDTAACIENMLLAAHALGYGSCWVGAFDEEKAAAILDLPGSRRPLAMLPVGVPQEQGMRIPPRRKIEEVTDFR